MRPQAGPGIRTVPGCSMFRLDMGNSLLPDPLEPVTVSVHFRDIHVVGEPVHRRAGDPFRSGLFGPYQR